MKTPPLNDQLMDTKLDIKDDEFARIAEKTTADKAKMEALMRKISEQDTK